MGVNFEYAEQPSPDGLAQAFIIGESFIGKDNVCLVLGDNIFYGAGLQKMLQNSVSMVDNEGKSVVFGYYVDDPERYGVAEIDKQGNVLSIEEKPKEPKSNYAVVGLYFYPNSVVEVAKNVKPSWRGEPGDNICESGVPPKGSLKLGDEQRIRMVDTGTHEALSEATDFVKTIEKRTSLKISCIEEIALIMGYIDRDQFVKLTQELGKSTYADYLKRLIKSR